MSLAPKGGGLQQQHGGSGRVGELYISHFGIVDIRQVGGQRRPWDPFRAGYLGWPRVPEILTLSLFVWKVLVLVSWFRPV